MKKPQTIFYFDESGFKAELEKNSLNEQRANEVYEALKRCEIENISIKTGSELSDLCRDPNGWLKRHIVNKSGYDSDIRHRDSLIQREVDGPDRTS